MEGLINKLSGSRCYLCGPIDCAIDGGTTWRHQVTLFLKQNNIIVIDPTNKPTEDLNEDSEFILYKRELRKCKKWDKLSSLMKKIRSFDLRCTDISDWSIAYLDYSIPMNGTYEEIFTLNRSKKPVLLFCEQGIDKIGDWFFGTLPHQLFFDEWDKLYQYILDINNGTITDTLNRWVFFNYKDLINA